MLMVPAARMAIVTIQDSFEDVIADVESQVVETESIWVAKRYSDNEDHQEFYKVQVSLDQGKIRVDSPDVQFTIRGNHKYTVGIQNDIYETEGPQYRFDTSNEAITAVAVTQNGSMLIVGNSNGDIVVYDVDTKEKKYLICGAHLSAVTQLIVMPSDHSLLSVGADFQIRLWLLDNQADGAVRTFLQQKKQISDIALIGKGRNFLSLSLDGLVNLWECGSGSVVSTFRRIDNMDDPCTCLVVSTVDGLPEQKQDPRLFECSNKVVYVGYESGLIQQYSVEGHYQTGVKLRPDFGRFQKKNVSVSSIRMLGKRVVAGYSNGTIVVWEGEKGEKHYCLELNENYPVENLCVELYEGNKAVFIVSNGPDLLLKVFFDVSTGLFHYRYLIGLPELFQAELAACNSHGLVVASNNEIVVFR